QLDLAIASIVCLRGAVDERLRVFLDTERNAYFDALAYTTQHCRERGIAPLRFERPARHFDCGLGHVMTAHILVEDVAYIARRSDLLANHARREPFANRQPRRIDCLRCVLRRLARYAFVPHMRAVVVFDLEQEDAPLADHAGRNAERL